MSLPARREVLHEVARTRGTARPCADRIENRSVLGCKKQEPRPPTAHVLDTPLSGSYCIGRIDCYGKVTSDVRASTARLCGDREIRVSIQPVVDLDKVDAPVKQSVDGAHALGGRRDTSEAGIGVRHRT